MDSFRHREDFVQWAFEHEMNFDYFLSRLYSEDVSFIDIVMPLLKFLVSRVTDNPDVFYGVLGFLFGYFFSRNIFFLINFYNVKLSAYSILFIFMFAFVAPPWEINSFRFWFATHIFLYGCFKLFSGKSKMSYLYILITPFIHFGYIFAIILFAIYKLIGNRIKLYFILFIASIFLNEINLQSIKALIPETSIGALDKKTSGYTSEGYIEERAETASQLNWYVGLKSKPVKYVTMLVVIFIYFKYRKRLIESELLSIFCIALFIFSLSYLLMNSVPVFGRYNRLGQLFLYGFLFLFFIKYKDDNITWYKNIFPFHIAAAALFILVDIRSSFDTMTIDTIISNPLLSAFYRSHEPIINFIK
ncbi:hypothetical protein GWA97_00645 [Flavobacterium sp. LaA7.5]|nr:hypothetical protein [Flavobacterium salilacus subsp. altitudinum]